LLGRFLAAAGLACGCGLAICDSSLGFQFERPASVFRPLIGIGKSGLQGFRLFLGGWFVRLLFAPLAAVTHPSAHAALVTRLLVPEQSPPGDHRGCDTAGNVL